MMQVGIVWVNCVPAADAGAPPSGRHMPCANGEIRYSDQWESPHDRGRLSQDCPELGRRGSVHYAGLPAFRVIGRKFASLASQAEGCGNLMLTLEHQAAFVEEAAEIFLPIPGGWGTHIRLAAASEEVLTGALRTAWKLRIDKNAKTSRKKPSDGA
jgi:hypothetical protein